MTRKSTIMRGAGIAILAIAVLTSVLLLPVRDYVVLFLAWADRVGTLGGIVMIGLYVLACVLFIPGTLVTLAAGFLFGLFWGTVVVSLGSLSGATAAFLLGRTLARDWVAVRLANWPRFAAIDRAVARQGFKIVLIMRLSPIFPFNVLNYAFGLTRVSLWDYVLASWLGMLPWTVVYVYVGTAAKSMADLLAGRAGPNWLRIAALIAGLVGALAAAVVITRLARRELNQAVAQDNGFSDRTVTSSSADQGRAAS